MNVTNTIHIGKKTQVINGREVEVYIVPALSFQRKDNPNPKKIPHPLGKDFLIFESVEEAQQAIEHSGFTCAMPHTIKRHIEKQTYHTSYDDLILDSLEKLADDIEDNYLVSFIGFAPLDDPQILIYTVVDTPNVESQASSSYAQYLAQAILSEVLPYMNIPQDEETTEETVLWQGFYGVPKLTDTIEDGVSNPYGTVLDQGYGDGDTQETELNDEYSDGITNEEAGIDENDPSYQEDAYDTEELEDFGQESDTQDTEDSGDTAGG